jgi:VanZ family protein
LSQGVGTVAPASLQARVLAWVPVLVWVGVVLLLSTGSFSASTSGRFLTPLLLSLGFSFEQVAVAHFFVRKGAHVTEYAIFAYLCARAAGLSFRAPLAAGVAVGIALLLAGLDEWNQSFEPTRTGTPRDVAFDVSGAVLGSLLWSVRRSLVR